MKRRDFIKLISTGALVPITGFGGCSKSEENKQSKEKSQTARFDQQKEQNSSVVQEKKFTSIAELRKWDPDQTEITNSANNGVTVLGYYEPDDGGGGEFKWDNDATEEDNNGANIKPQGFDSNKPGRWRRVFKGDEVSVKIFGAKGNSSGVDDQPAIQKTINYASENNISKVVIPKGDYTVKLNKMPIGRDSSLDLKDNTHLKMDEDSILRLPKEEAKTSYNILRIAKRDNVKIEGGTIIGNKLTSTASKGEWGMGVGIYYASNITIDEVVIKQQWGDGIYIAGGENIVITDTLCDKNRRQGMSVISVNGLHVENCQFNNTKGARPESGIDFEPNNANEQLKNIYLKNIKCINNNGHGILFYLKNITTENNPEVTINISDAYISHSGVLIKAFGARGTGFINIENTVVKNNQIGAAYAIENWHKDAPPIRLKNIVALNPNVSGKGGTSWGSALIFRKGDVDYDNGNLHIDGFEVKSDGSATANAPKDIYVDSGLWNCSFKNIKSKADRLYNVADLQPEKNNIFDSALRMQLKIE